MSDIKPLGSERLQGMDKIKRIIEISKYNEKKPVSINESSTSEYSLKLSDGNEYKIIKEKNGYIIKKAINESETEYIDKIENRKFHKSYSQALRKLNLMAKEFNSLNENEIGTELFTEQKKYFLKTPKPSVDSAPVPDMGMDAPAPDMGMDAPAPDMGMDVPTPDMGMEAPTPDMGDEEMPDMGDEEMPDMGDEEMPENDQEGSDEEVTLKSIQKLVGKLSQKLRTISKNEEEIDSKDIKYVINSILSAVDLDKLEDDDKEEILGRFDSDDEETPDMGDEEIPDMGDEEIPEPEVEAPQPPSDGELGEDQGEMGKKFKTAVNKAYGLGLQSKSPVHSAHQLEGELDETEIGAVDGMLDELFTESKVDKILSKYFVLSEGEKKKIKTKKQKVYSEIVRLSESVDQEIIAKRIVNKYPDVKLLGKTNKQNLVFENKNKQFKVTTSGKII